MTISDDDDPEPMLVLPPGPRCARCGHVLCPCCGDWCDTLIWIDDEPYPCECIEQGGCAIERGAFELWAARWPHDPGIGEVITVAEGPWWPGEAR